QPRGACTSCGGSGRLGEKTLSLGWNVSMNWLMSGGFSVALLDACVVGFVRPREVSHATIWDNEFRVPPGGGIRRYLAVPGAWLLARAPDASLLAGPRIPCCPSRKPARAACAPL